MGFTALAPRAPSTPTRMCAGFLAKKLRANTPQTSAELAELILEEAEVAVVPGEAFGPSGYLRLSYALSDEDLMEGISRLQKLLGSAR